MTVLERLVKEINEELKDEKESYEKYEEMSKEFDKLGHEEVAGMLKDMAVEEELHHKHLNYIIALLDMSSEEGVKSNDEQPLEVEKIDNEEKRHSVVQKTSIFDTNKSI